MKKLLVILLAMCMVLALATACGEDKPETNEPVTPSNGEENKPNDSKDDPKDDPKEDPAETEDPVSPEPAGEMIVVIPDVFEYDSSRVLYSTDFSEMGEWNPRHIGDDEDHGSYSTYMNSHGTTHINVELVDIDTPSGDNKAIFVSERYTAWTGITIDLTDMFSPTLWDYEIFAWVKVPEGQPDSLVQMSYQLTNYIGGPDGIANDDFKQWGDIDSEEGILSKRMLPTSLFDPDGDWKVAYNEDYFTEDGWMLLRGETSIISSNYDKIQVYVETGSGIADFYVDQLVILKGE
ncbi:MAG: hypothetical protein FWG44_06795 [Oscillospiraceae bacterium]|nr:hypothetical protein [Oscillospiraceae bacterium]